MPNQPQCSLACYACNLVSGRAHQACCNLADAVFFLLEFVVGLTTSKTQPKKLPADGKWQRQLCVSCMPAGITERKHVGLLVSKTFNVTLKGVTVPLSLLQG